MEGPASEDSGRAAAKALSDILEAAQFAAERHSAQRRKGPDALPYINHLIEVAALLAASQPELDAELVMAGFLHDTIEDARVTADELQERFGPGVAALVVEVTDNKKLEKPERKRLQVENAPTKSARAQALGAADKISNMRSVLLNPPVNWSYARKREYFDWAKRVVDRYPNLSPVLRAEFDRLYPLFDEYVKP
jgi:guanosine-3',5'-bis(diphosphate) 3'-pyrophosphohydrolase